MGWRGLWAALVERRSTVDAHRFAGVAQAAVEVARVVVSWHVPSAPHDVVDVLAEPCGLWTWLARPNAKFSIRHEAGPFLVLHHLAAVRAPEDESTDRVAITVSTVRVKLSSRITFRNADLGEVALACDLNIVRGLDPMRAQNSTVRDQASAVSVLQAICDFAALGFSYRCVVAVRVWRCPDAPIRYGVDENVLTHRGWAACCPTAIGSFLPFLPRRWEGVGVVWVIGVAPVGSLRVNIRDSERDESQERRGR